MLQRMPSRLFTEWQAFSRVEPFGYEVDMFGHALTSSSVLNVNRKKGSPAIQPHQLFPDFKQGSDEDKPSFVSAFKSWARRRRKTNKKKKS